MESEVYLTLSEDEEERAPLVVGPKCVRSEERIDWSREVGGMEMDVLEEGSDGVGRGEVGRSKERRSQRFCAVWGEIQLSEHALSSR